MSFHKSAIVAAAASILGLASLVLVTTGTTFAVWSDADTVASQTITVGINDLAKTGTVVLTNLKPGAPQAFPFTLTGTAQGNSGLTYEMSTPQISVTGLAGVTNTEVIVVSSAAACTTSATGTKTLYSGKLTAVATAKQPLVAAGRSTTTGTAYLCIQLSLPTGYGSYVNTGTVTGSSSAGTVEASAPWYGIAGPPAASSAATVVINFNAVTFR